MKGVRFYEEYEDKRRGVSAGACLAVVPEQAYFDAASGWVFDCVGPVMADHLPNTSGLCGCGVAHEYLRETCKRVSEKRARQIHPALFEMLKEWGW